MSKQNNVLNQPEITENDLEILRLHRGTSADSSEKVQQLRQQIALTYRAFFRNPQNTEAEAKKISAILELSAHDTKLCKLLRTIDEEEIG